MGERYRLSRRKQIIEEHFENVSGEEAGLPNVISWPVSWSAGGRGHFAVRIHHPVKQDGSICACDVEMYTLRGVVLSGPPSSVRSALARSSPGSLSADALRARGAEWRCGDVELGRRSGRVGAWTQCYTPPTPCLAESSRQSRWKSLLLTCITVQV